MSSSREKLAARDPRRERGKRRVAALLESTASVFAEKGYEAVTMTEVAARAIRATDEVSGSVISIGLVLGPVFIPRVHQRDRRPVLPPVRADDRVSTLISALDLVTISPAPAAVPPKPREPTAEVLTRPVFAVLGGCR